MRFLSIAIRVLIVLVTLLFLSSIGGAMAYAAPGLVPIHWWMARSANKGTRWGWILLAFLSTAEAAAIYSYLALGYFSWVVGLGTASAIAIAFLLTLGSIEPRPDDLS